MAENFYALLMDGFEGSGGMTKILRYIDLTKFVSLLTHEALYFACPVEFNDPYEGYLPKSHIDAITSLNQKFIDKQLQFWDQIVAKNPGRDLSVEKAQFDAGIEQYHEQSKNAFHDVNFKFGVSCWHRSEHESEAMWKLYSNTGQGIALESTVDQLRESINDKDGLYIEDVRYADFDSDPIEKGHKHYGLVMKRKSFEHEKEVRAFKMLKENGKGMLLKCDLDVLISRIHIAPNAPMHFTEVVDSLCNGKVRRINKSVVRSLLFEKPSY